MQYFDFKINTEQKATQLTKYLILMVACVLVWLLPATHDFCASIDVKFFRTINNSTALNRTWGLFWAYLNHKSETWLNLVLMIGINLYAVYSQPYFRRAKALAGTIYFWLFFQIVLLASSYYFGDLFGIQRISPSIALKSVVNLSDFYEIPNLKITSSDCFPAGHTLVFIFWAKFSMLYSKPRLQKVILGIATFLLLPRLFSGAHWLSDVIFTIFYALFWYELAVGSSLFPYATKKLEKLCSFIEPRRQTAGAI